MPDNTPKDNLSARYLRSIFDYDPEKGVLKRLNSHRHRNPMTEYKGYVRHMIDGEVYLEHRLIWVIVHGVWPPADIDHVNGNRSDNRLANLRLASRSLNHANQRPRATGHLKGIYVYQNRWYARVKLHGVCYALGGYATEEEAHLAYCEGAKRLFGAYARTK